MPQPEKLLQLILNSVTLNKKLTAESLEVFIGRAFALDESRQTMLIELFEQEERDVKQAAAKQGQIIEVYYKKLKTAKIRVVTQIRKEAEKETTIKETAEAESLLVGL